MLGRSTETPRPRPLKARRSTSKTASPPPAYAPSFTFPSRDSETILGSPLAATFQKFNWDSVGKSYSPEADHEWMNEQSQEELAGLLAKADGLIKKREDELSLASDICRNLYESNVNLKSKHQALLARLPLGQDSSPPVSPTIEQDALQTSVDSDDIGGFYKHSRLSTYRRHSRRISMTTNDISMLADQNAELLQKLEKLELDSTRADQAGRRELRRLEKEISYLKEELEKSQILEEELGQKAEKAVEDAWRKKKARDGKFKAMRNLRRDFHSDGNHEVKNFAPEGSGFGGPSDGFSFFPPTGNDNLQDPLPAGTELSSSSSQTQDSSSSEKGLISQLLAKMKELEATNMQILEQQTRTAGQLEAVQRETEHIHKVYECLADPEQVQLEFETPQQQRNRSSLQDEAIRFGSFRKRLESELDSSRATLSHGSFDRRESNGSSRPRKSVVGLFDTIKSEVGSFSEDVNMRTSDNASPALSALNLFSPATRLDPSGPTLESELGGVFTESWGAHAGNYHLRTTSLTDFAHFAPISPSPGPPVLLPRIGALGLNIQDAGKEGDPTSLGTAGDDIDLPTKVGNDDFISTSSTAPKSPRYQRMTQTIRSRTGRLADRRFKDTLSGRTTGERANRPLHGPNGVIHQPLIDAVDTLVENNTGRLLSDESNPTPPAASPGISPTNENAVQLHPEPQSPEKRPRGISAILLEIWLWLQFVIIIFVFVWAMAKRGPKSVLREVEKSSVSKRT